MDNENLSFLTELTDEDASHVNGGFYISDLGIYNWNLETLYDSLSIVAYPPVIDPTNFGGILG